MLGFITDLVNDSGLVRVTVLLPEELRFLAKLKDVSVCMNGGDWGDWVEG